MSYLLIPEKLIDLVQKGQIHFWLLILIAHIIATIIIYLFSVILKNSSLYDPFWSVAPVPIVIILSMGMETLEIKLLVLIPICFWALRLTRNWIISWPEWFISVLIYSVVIVTIWSFVSNFIRYKVFKI